MKNKLSINKKNRTINLWMALFSFALLLATSPTIKAQPSLAKMYDMTRTWNQNLWDEQRRLQQFTDRLGKNNSGKSSTLPTNPNGVTPPQQTTPIRQYPITVTDFSPAPNRLAVEDFINGVPNLTREQRDLTRKLFY